MSDPKGWEAKVHIVYEKVFPSGRSGTVFDGVPRGTPKHWNLSVLTLGSVTRTDYLAAGTCADMLDGMKQAEEAEARLMKAEGGR